MDTALSTKRNDYLIAIQKLRLIDDDFMRIIFDNWNCLELLLSIVLNVPVTVISCQMQYVLNNLHGRDARIDAFIKTLDNCYINVEVQRKDEGANPKRARYHHSLIDADISYPNEKWKDIPPVIVIFITEHDVLNGGLPIYHIKRTVEETGDHFHDESEIIYVNASIQDETPLGRLMHDFMCRDYHDMHYDILRNEVRYFKDTEGGKQKMCEIMEEIERNGERRGEIRGEIKGEIKGKISILKQLIKQQIGQFTPEIQARLEQCSSQQLDQLVITILYVKTEDDLLKALSC